MMDGTIQVESKLGEGSTFSFDVWFNLPSTQTPNILPLRELQGIY
jgi:signal transduction histidine kinase